MFRINPFCCSLCAFRCWSWAAFAAHLYEVHSLTERWEERH